MGNSKLVDYTKKSPNHSGPRTHSIDRITPHCIVGQWTVEKTGDYFSSVKNASCNYCIGTDGKVGLIVDEANRSWCSSDTPNDQRAVTIECASDAKHPYAFNDAVYKKLIKLCIDICKRNGKSKLIWISDKNKALSYKQKSNEMLLTVHRWFKAKACPGDWLFNRLGDLADEVNKELSKKEDDIIFKPYVVRIITDNLNLREGPGAKYKILGKITDKGSYTIIDEKNGWGLLKSKAGWIKLSHAEKV